MTREELIRMTREAGIRDCTCDGEFGCLERFAALVAAAEREEFAVHAVDIARRAIAEEREACVRRAEIAMLGADRELTLRLIAAIQARGQA